MTIGELEAEKVETSYHDLQFAVILSNANGAPYVALNKNTAENILDVLGAMREKAEE